MLLRQTLRSQRCDGPSFHNYGVRHVCSPFDTRFETIARRRIFRKPRVTNIDETANVPTQIRTMAPVQPASLPASSRFKIAFVPQSLICASSKIERTVQVKFCDVFAFTSAARFYFD